MKKSIMNLNIREELQELLTLSLEKKTSQEQVERLNAILDEYPDALQHCLDFYLIAACLSQSRELSETVINELNNKYVTRMQLLTEFAQYEKTAPQIEIPVEEPHRDLIQKVVYPSREKRKMSRFSVVFLAMSTAAILFFFLFLRFVPPKGGVQVATLTDSIGAEWAGNSASFDKGARMAIGNESLLLREGYVELLFDTNARVVIEAPAEFQIVDSDRISLNYGKIYSQVPTEAIGFSVYTPNSKIIDLGTEFGIEVDFRGETRLHVIQGVTKLIAGKRSETTSVEVQEGEAKKISAANSKISEFSCKSDLFVRRIDSKNNFVWRGQKKCNLADIVGGGDGFGKGQVNLGIDHKGQTTLLDNIVAYTQPIPFTSVSSNPFVNGIFVPYGPTQIDSLGNGVYDFGATSGKFYLGILNGAWHQQRDNAVPRHPLRLGGMDYGTHERPAIYIHANQGITFDLTAIREYTQMEINKFTSVCGVSETYGDYAEAIRKARQFENIKLPKASFYILVDGRERFIRKDITHLDGPAVISVDIAPQDRYLTLVTTESSDKNDGDWTLFGEPVLMLQSE